MSKGEKVHEQFEKEKSAGTSFWSILFWHNNANGTCGSDL